MSLCDQKSLVHVPKNHCVLIQLQFCDISTPQNLHHHIVDANSRKINEEFSVEVSFRSKIQSRTLEKL